MEKTFTIASLETQLTEHRQHRAGLHAALTVLPRVAATPVKTGALAQQAATFRAEIEGLDVAIADLEVQRTQAQAQAQVGELAQAEVDDQAELSAGRDLAAELAAELAAAVALVEVVLRRIGRELPAYDDAHRRLRLRSLPSEYPTDMHRMSAQAGAAATAFLDGQGLWQLPRLVQLDGRMVLVAQAIDIRPPAPVFRIAPGGHAGGNGNHPTPDQIMVARPVPAGADEVSRHLIEAGFTVPRAAR
jgi:hypothetical protein